MINMTHRSWMSMIPSTRKTWKVLDIQVFTFSDLETNGTGVVYFINQKGTDILLIGMHIITVYWCQEEVCLTSLIKICVLLHPIFYCQFHMKADIISSSLQFGNTYIVTKWTPRRLDMEKVGLLIVCNFVCIAKVFFFASSLFVDSLLPLQCRTGAERRNTLQWFSGKICS